MTKTQKVVVDMLEHNKELFDCFREIHDKFALDPEPNRDKFNEIGRDIQDVMRRYENILCGKSESSGYSKFSTNLADKFQAEVKSIFPKINSIGVIKSVLY